MNNERLSCGEVQERLPLFVGGDLDAEVLDAVRGHLEACEECAARAAEASRARMVLLSSLRTRAAEAAAPALWTGIRETLHAEGRLRGLRPIPAPEPELEAVRRMAPRPRRYGWMLVPAAAAALLAVVLRLGSGPDESLPGRSPSGLLVQQDERAAPLEVLPVSAPSGGLQRVDPLEFPELPAPYRAGPRRMQGASTAAGGIWSAGFRGFK